MEITVHMSNYKQFQYQSIEQEKTRNTKYIPESHLFIQKKPYQSQEKLASNFNSNHKLWQSQVKQSNQSVQHLQTSYINRKKLTSRFFKNVTPKQCSQKVMQEGFKNEMKKSLIEELLDIEFQLSQTSNFKTLEKKQKLRSLFELEEQQSISDQVSEKQFSFILDLTQNEKKSYGKDEQNEFFNFPHEPTENNCFKINLINKNEDLRSKRKVLKNFFKAKNCMKDEKTSCSSSVQQF